jgi:hypothetical protein
VLGLLLLILVLIAGGFFLVRYLRSRQPTTHPVSAVLILRVAQDDITASVS